MVIQERGDVVKGKAMWLETGAEFNISFALPTLEEEDLVEECLRLTKEENSNILDLGGSQT